MKKEYCIKCNPGENPQHLTLCISCLDKGLKITMQDQLNNQTAVIRETYENIGIQVDKVIEKDGHIIVTGYCKAAPVGIIYDE